MAQGKKSFVAYSDWKDVFDELPDEDAGKLIKHIFAYVNDEDPISDSVLIKAVFANIKSTLKRDLDKWESQLQQRSQAGKKSAEQRAINKSNEKSTFVESRARKSTVSDSVSVSVNKNLLSEIDRDSLIDLDKMYFDIAIGFRDRFILNKKRLGLSNFKDQENATYKNYVEPIRLAFEKDKRTKEDFEKIFRFLTYDEFWMKNIMSTSKLREKMNDLLIKASKLQSKPIIKPTTSKYSV
jgi:hypothetical protein